jgi:hypothetical protein
MRGAATATALILILSALPGSARADTIHLGTATFTTSGTFNCKSRVPCTGEGTNSITITSDGEAATLTFNGMSGSLDITNAALPVTVGSFTMTATDGFVFPPKWNNPKLPILNFSYSLVTGDPIAAHAGRLWQFGPGGSSTITLQGGLGYDVLPGPGNGYGTTVFTYNPFPFTLAPGTTDLTADVGAAPEPASMVLLGTGLVGAALSRRRRRRSDVGGWR